MCDTLGTRLSPRLSAGLPGAGVGHGGSVTPLLPSPYNPDHAGIF